MSTIYGNCCPVFFNNDDIVSEVNTSPTSYSYLSEDNNKDAPVTTSHMVNPYQKLINEYITKPTLQLSGRKQMVVRINMDLR